MVTQQQEEAMQSTQKPGLAPKPALGAGGAGLYLFGYQYLRKKYALS
jgi:hypothetical protein